MRKQALRLLHCRTIYNAEFMVRTFSATPRLKNPSLLEVGCHALSSTFQIMDGVFADAARAPRGESRLLGCVSIPHIIVQFLSYV